VPEFSGCRIALLFDAYELLSDSQIDDTPHRKLLLLSPHLLRIIFTRIPLPWEHKFPKEWGGKIVHIPSLNELSLKDATLLLQKKRIDNPVLQEHLYQLTRGYPLHIELCADICQEIEDAEGKEPEINDFEGAIEATNLTEELVHRLLRQLKDDEKDLIGLAAYPRWISEEVLEVLSSIPESVPRIFKKFTSLSMFSPHPELPNAYVIRKEVRDCLLQQQQKARLFKQRHGKLSQFHNDMWQETGSFHHFREALFHRFHETPEEALKIFEEHFWKLLDEYHFGEAESLLEAIPIKVLNETEQRKIEFARARFLTRGAQSQESLITAQKLYETLITSETDEMILNEYNAFLGDLFEVMGKNEKALECYQSTLPILLKHHGENHPDIAGTYYNIGLIYWNEGEYSKALENHKKALDIRLNIFGEEHSAVGNSYNSIGLVYFRRGDYQKALEYLQKSLSIFVRVCGEEHVFVACAYNNIGLVYQRTHEYEKALEYHQKSLATVRKICGEETIDIGTIYDNIGLDYSREGNYGQALKYHQKSLMIYSKICGENHPNTARSYANIGFIHLDKDEYVKALEQFEKALDILLNFYREEHPYIASTYSGIGSVYKGQGKYAKALEFYRKGLAIRLKIFGEVHPDVADSYRNIACTLWALKSEEEAVEQIQKSVDIHRKVQLWQNAVRGMDTLSGWLEEKGKAKEAKDIRIEADKIREDHDLF
jgi:tetratricopeptide (TPR) repeat protein